MLVDALRIIAGIVVWPLARDPKCPVSAAAIFAAEDVCAVAPVHSSVELSLWRVHVSVETTTHNSMSSTGSPNTL